MQRPKAFMSDVHIEIAALAGCNTCDSLPTSFSSPSYRRMNFCLICPRHTLANNLLLIRCINLDIKNASLAIIMVAFTTMVHSQRHASSSASQ